MPITTEDLMLSLNRVLHGEATLEELWGILDTARLHSPGAVGEFRQSLDALYSRNEVRYDVYLVIKDRLAAMARLSPATHPGAHGTSPPVATRAPSSTRSPPQTRPPTGPAQSGTILRSASSPAETRAAPDRTIVRSPTGPLSDSVPMLDSTGSLRKSSTSPAGSQWDEGAWTSTTEQPLEPGSLIKGRFMLEERVGAGGMGVVFKARDLRKEEAQDRDPYVAIKFLNPSFRTHADSLKALQRETRRAQTLAHPNVVTVYDFDRDGTLIFMTMEFLTGEPLDLFIQRHPQGIRFGEAWPLIEGAGRALMYAHEQGVIHADFKPGNVFVSEKKAKVLDFGIARAMKAQTANQTGTRFDAGTLGALTPAYASPEMLLNEEPDPRDDIYALACVAYELMTGKHPFNGQTAVKAAHDGLKVKRTKGMGRYQHKALAHGLAFRRNDRTPSVEKFLDEIAGPFGVRGRAVRSALLSTAGTAIFVSLAAAGIWWFLKPDPDKQLARRLCESATAQIEESRRNGAQVEELPPEMSKLLLEQGDALLAMARGKFDPRVLSEGVSNAHDAFDQVLQGDPCNLRAVNGIVAIVDLYEVEIRRRLDAGNYPGVVELTGYARKIDPNRASFEDAEREAKSHLAPAAANAEEK